MKKPVYPLGTLVFSCEFLWIEKERSDPNILRTQSAWISCMRIFSGWYLTHPGNGDDWFVPWNIVSRAGSDCPMKRVLVRRSLCQPVIWSSPTCFGEVRRLPPPFRSYCRLILCLRSYVPVVWYPVTAKF